MVWLAGPAFAVAVFDSGSNCFSGGEVIFAVPPTGAVGVPVDVSPAFVFSSQGCTGEVLASMQLTETASGAFVAEEEGDVGDGLGELHPSAPLGGSNGYTVSTTTFSQEVTVAFQTGTQTSTPAGVVPTVEALTATWLPDEGRVHLDATVSYSGAGGADLIAQWSDGPDADAVGSAVTRLGAPGRMDEAAWSSTLFPLEKPTQWCVLPRTREIDGSWVAGDSKCVEVTTLNGCGCAATAVPGAWFALAAAGLGLVARRRR